MSVRRRASLSRRVALSSALAAALGGAVAAMSAGIAARELVGTHEEATVRSALRELRSEVLEELDEADDDDDRDDREPKGAARTLDALLAHELEDVDMPEAAAAVFRNGARIAGATDVPKVAAGSCALFAQPAPTRACATSFGEGVLVLSVRTEAEQERARLVQRALLVGLLSGALLGGLFSYVTARWALRPLTELRNRVRLVRADQPNADIFAEPFVHSEPDELQQAIVNLVERLGTALSQAQRFAAEAAHELRTPLATIAGEIELLEETAHNDDRIGMERARRHVAALVELVERLLILAGTGLIDAEYAEVVELRDVLDSVQSALPATLRERLTVYEGEDVSVHGDGALLRALFSNAIENALKFSAGSVHVRLTRAGEHALVDIEDEGPGMPLAEQARVFEPFYRTATARAGAASGHGLGLALIARVAQAHGGDAAFLTVPRGATLRVRFPVWRARKPAAPTT